jgi:negative regulator of replication initiation
MISSLNLFRETRLKLIKTRADGGYCNKDAVDKIVNSKTESNRVKAMKNIALPGEYFEECEAVLKHLDFMINLARLAAQGAV